MVLSDMIRNVFKLYPNVLYAFTEMKDCEYVNKYRSALVFAVPYKNMINQKTYAEDILENEIQLAKESIKNITLKLEEVFRQKDISFYIPPAVQRDEETLVAPISYKYVAVQAGLGWIGKNDLLITKQYGPRVRLSDRKSVV